MADLEKYTQTRKQHPGGSRPVESARATREFIKDMARQRKAQGQSQTQVAAAMRTSAAVVSRLEGGTDVQLSTLEKYVAALGLRLELKGVALRKPKSPRPLSDALRARPISSR